MSLLGKFRNTATRWLRRDPAHRAPRRRTTRAFERVESRQMLAANLHLGAVYYEDAAGQDIAPDTIEITWIGGAPGTQLTQLVIDTDKEGNGLTIGDVFFDTQSGGLGAFGAGAFQIVSQSGIDSVNVQVDDGGTKLVLSFVGFDAGEKLVFTIDVDEQGFLGPNAVAEGNEFEGSQLKATFAAPHYYEAQASDIFLDAYDSKFAGKGLDLPPDNYVPPSQSPQPVRTAGGLVSLEQVPLPIAIRGTVYDDLDLNKKRETNEPGLAGVTLTLYRWNGNSYDSVATTTTDAQGRYRFDNNVLPGRYRIVETQPSGYISVSSSAGTVNGQTRGRADTVDILADIDLLGGEESVDNDFGEARPVTLSGHVYHDADNDGQRDPGEQGIAGALLEVRRRAANGTFLTIPLVVVTDALGAWIAQGLEPGDYDIREQQPSGYLDGLDAIGNAGGLVENPGDHMTNIRLLSGASGVNYDFGELKPSSISGRVLADADGDCEYDPGERWLQGVTVYLLDANGQRIGSTTTNSEGRYEFTGLAPGVYGVEEIQPPGLYDGGDHIGSAGGKLVGPDSIREIVLVSGTVGVNYDFCEVEPVSISGFVYVDDNQNGQFDSGEQTLSGVALALLDANGNATGATVVTDSTGFYIFDGLAPGTYGVAETQPSNYYDGLDSAGTAGGTAQNPGDRITGAVLSAGVYGNYYNFGELRPASLRGLVHADRDGDCVYDPEFEDVLPGVVIELLDADGRVIRTTVTDATGQYAFTNLEPGVYGVHEIQPDGYFQGGKDLGTHGGVESGVDLMTEIRMGSGADARDYNFCEKEPVGIAGRVWADLDQDCIYDAGAEQPLSGVTIELLDASGNVVATTTTGADGRYQFDQQMPGEYQVREQQPAGYYQGGQVVGSAGGVVLDTDHLGQIILTPGVFADGYDFCELPPANLAGQVYLDLDGDCVRDANEQPLPGVTIELLDSAGNLVTTTATGSDGRYAFSNLRPDEYQVRERQPSGYYQGGQVVGNAGGVILDADHIGQIELAPGVFADNYDFCELPPASLAGVVYVDYDGDCVFDAEEAPLAGVTIELLNDNGDVVATTTSGTDGRYRFDHLQPGVYGVREIQPNGYFQGGTVVGSAGGVAGEDIVESIPLAPSVDATGYNFCERLPGKISGYVFRDGSPISYQQGEQPPDPATVRDGLRTSDDQPIAGVTLLLTYTGGEPVLDGNGQQRTAVTDANGYYEFTDLAPGSYTVFQLQPVGYDDFFDTPGTTGGLVANRNSDVPQPLQLYDHNYDVVGYIGVDAGAVSNENNFAEVQYEEEPVGPPVNLPPPTQPERVPPQLAPLVAPRLAPAILPLAPAPNPDFYSGGARSYTWHLSVINGGAPRGLKDQAATPATPVVSRATAFAWGQQNLSRGRFIVRQGQQIREIRFGHPDALPVAGDFNGDGRAEVGVFIDGQWFIDRNGNGRFDAEDLWAEMGKQRDEPVAGDWDGDGKADIGIFGPAWPRDARAIAAEPGLPDGQNQHNAKPKNLPPTADEATAPERLLKPSAGGAMRSDFVDHVFQWGFAGDRPIVGDWNGEGIASIGVFRSGMWQLDTDGDGRLTAADMTLRFGQTGDVPIVGDWNGDGRTDLGVYRRGRWHIDSNGNRQLDDGDETFELGGPDDLPVAADFDGDGADDAAVYEVDASEASAPEA